MRPLFLVQVNVLCDVSIDLHINSTRDASSVRRPNCHYACLVCKFGSVWNWYSLGFTLSKLLNDERF